MIKSANSAQPLQLPAISTVIYNVIWYDTKEEFNVDSKAECDQLNLAHVARKKYKKKKLKQTNASAHLVQYRFKIREGSPEWIRVTMEE